MVGYYLTITDPNKSSINMEFFKGTTKFTTGQAPKDELVRGAPSTSMSTPASGTLLARPVQEATLPPTPPNSPVEEDSHLRWDIEASQVAAGNLDATLLAFHAYLDATGRSVLRTGWKWAPGLSTEMSTRLSRFHQSEEMVKELIETYSGWADGPIIRVVAADTPGPILAKTSQWPDFKIDQRGLEQSMSGPGSLGVAVRCVVKVPSWERAVRGLTLETSGSNYGGDLLRLSSGENVVVSQDAFGFHTLHYVMSNWDYRLRVRITDVTKRTFATAQGASYDALLASHLAQREWPQDSRYKGAEFQSFRLGVGSAALRHCLGAENATWQLVAVQAAGHVEVSKSTPLNLDVKSVVVFRDRGWCDGPVEDKTYLDFSHQKAKRFTNLLEVDIQRVSEGKPSSDWLRLFDGLFSEANVSR